VRYCILNLSEETRLSISDLMLIGPKENLAGLDVQKLLSTESG
jgi:hypothetical protein